MKLPKPIPTVPCKICATPTPMTFTKLCDRCWELDRRIRADLNLARKIVDKYTQ